MVSSGLMQTLEISSVLPAADCLACSFTVEALVEQMTRGAFSLCPGHMVRAMAYSQQIVGAPFLTPL